MPDIVNYYEKLVSDQLWKMNQAADQPLPNNVLEDVTCLALNNLPPCYVRNLTDLSSHISERQYEQMAKKVEDVVLQALAQVNQRPRDRED